MNTYYIKQDNGTFAEVTFSDGMLITMIAEKLVGDSLLKATEVIKDTIQKRVSEVIYQSDLGTRTHNYLSTMSITDVVDEAVKDAVAEYDYDGVIDNALDNVDIDEMVAEKITDHLDSSSIQVRIS